MEVTDQDFIAIRSVVEQQLAAFQQDDAETAFSFAAPEIQKQFQNAENFLRMVSMSYPAVYRPRSVLFEAVTTIEDNITQPVLLLAPDGIPVRALYFMEKQLQGWKINGCILVSVETEAI